MGKEKRKMQKKDRGGGREDPQMRVTYTEVDRPRHGQHGLPRLV